jgi:hypothetical protein
MEVAPFGQIFLSPAAEKFTLPGAKTLKLANKTQSYIKGFIKKNPWCPCVLVAMFIRVKACQKAVFSFPCMVPIDCHKRIFYNPKALNDITFPFFDVPCCLNPFFLKPKYNISHTQIKNFPTKVKHLPTQNAVAANSNTIVTNLKHCRY